MGNEGNDLLDGIDTADDITAFLLGVIVKGARGEPYDEDRVRDLIGCLVAADLIRSGVPEAVVARQFDERPWGVRLTYNRDEGLEFGVDWLDEDEEALSDG